MSLALKHIPCPAGNNCTAFQCIFGHEKDKNASVTVQPAQEATARHAVQNKPANPSSTGSSDSPRKRLKLEQNSQMAQNNSQGNVAPRAVDGSQGRPQTATRPVSPPPLRRPAAGAPNRLSSSNASPAAKPQPLSKSGTSQTTGANAEAAKKTKPESLNPRLLKSSPASHETRLKLLRLLHGEYTRLNKELKKDANEEEQKLLLSDQQMIVRALDEEQKIAVEKAAVYANIMKNKVMQYKRLSVAQWKKERVEEKQAANKKRRGGDTSDEPRKIETGLTHAQEVQLLRRILTPIEDLSNHGYVPKVPSDEDIEKARNGLEMAKGWEKCDRCQVRFQVFPGRREEDGALTTHGKCNFHWGKLYVPIKAPGDRTVIPKRYMCCTQEVGESAGCFTHDHHVYKVTDSKRLALLLNFAETPENPLAPSDRAVCFDCEMCYTVHGLELVRLTATSWPTGEELLDVLVRPLGEILDLNSRFSGVWPEDMAQAQPWSADDPRPDKNGTETGSEDGELRSSKKQLKIVSSPEVARELLYSLVSPTTPLIGHGLENDLNAVRAVHPTLIDTVLLFKHKAGLPYRYGLKHLMSVHLNRKIQQETGPNVVGHDSAEDARAAGELVRLKIMEEWKSMQLTGWKVVDGEITPPTSKGKDAAGKLTEEFIES
ncbi:RNA exonuclease 3 [Paramyrothecium foliicola]|nr:RNA exonuclease 3 [Paramyrothecium foliicola]